MRGGFDGKSGWVSRADVVRPLEGEDLLRTIRDWDLLQYLRLKQSFSGFRVLGRDILANKMVIVVGAVAREGSRVKLYFDEGSGLLIRRADQIKTPYGMLPDVTDFEEYRKVAGITLPFHIRRSQPQASTLQELSEIRFNVTIDDQRFTPAKR